MTDPLVAELRKFAEKYEGGKVGSLLAQAAKRIEEMSGGVRGSSLDELLPTDQREALNRDLTEMARRRRQAETASGGIALP